MATVSLTMSLAKIKQLAKKYQAYSEPPGQYQLYRFRLPQAVITVYQSHKVVFQGNQAEILARTYQPAPNFSPHLGSDEVGTGDYFGPVCVAAVYLSQADYDVLKNQPLTDSKALTDELIMKLAPQLIKRLKHQIVCLTPHQYNELQVTRNMNSIKAYLHNQALLRLKKQLAPLTPSIIVDQFASPKNYYHYLLAEADVVSDITFVTKAESKYAAVAAASIIARYTFLTELAKLSKQYQHHFLKGAGVLVDENAREFLMKYPVSELSKVAKLHFKNTERILGPKINQSQLKL